MSDLPRSNDLEATWKFVEPGLNRIVGGGEDTTDVTPGMYMNVYSAVYNYCVNKSRSPGNFESNNNNNNGSQSSLLVGAEIYEKLNAYLKGYVKSLHKKPNEHFLEFYVKRWTRYTVGAGYLNHVFDYMNRYWVQKERSDGRRDIFDVNTLALLTWRDNMFNENVEVLVTEILEQIRLQRDNQVIDTGTLSAAIKSFVLLGIDIQDLKKPNLTIYTTHFEKPFLDATKAFYAKESSEYLASHNVVDYMRKAEQRLGEEESRENLYLDEHSKKPLTDCLNDVLIVSHAQLMSDEFQTLLDQNQIDHIAKMFSLFARVPTTLVPLADIFSKYVQAQGMKAVENLKNDIQNEANSAETPAKKGKNQVEPKQYVKVLIAVYQQYQDIVATAFQNHVTFVKALDNACKQFINNNVIGKPPGTKGTSKTPELLAKYSDNLLKKSKDADAASDMSIDEIMIVFKFLNDKDAFENHYRRLLARRLIHNTTASDEMEESVIQKLQQENSMEYTSKITRMFQDVHSSGELKTAFKEEMNKDPQMSKALVPDFDPYVLSETKWPFGVPAQSTFQLPADLIPTYSKFEEMFSKKHNGRVLKWLWNLSRGDLKANLQKPGRPPFMLSATLNQMAILLPYNDKDTYTLGQLCEVTGLDATTVANNLVPMVKFRLLGQSPEGAENMEKLDTKYTCVKEFKSKKIKVNLMQGVKSTEAKQEAEDAEREINEYRRNYLKACIVRIMKARKQLSHSALISEVIQQSHTRFLAKVPDIKRCVDELVEKEYLERNDDHSYNYLA